MRYINNIMTIPLLCLGGLSLWVGLVFDNGNTFWYSVGLIVAIFSMEINS